MLIKKLLKELVFILIVFINLSCAHTANASRVNKDLQTYDQTVNQMDEEFSKITKNSDDVEWVKLKLAHMFAVDQYMRNYGMNIPYQEKYSAAEKLEFDKQFDIRYASVDLKNTTDLKELLKKYKWFKISSFGEVADNQAWIIVQHADKDPAFQKEVLSVL